MKKSFVAVFILTAALAATAARADYYTFTSGEKIPLFDSSGAALSYVELQQNAKRDGTEYEMAQKNNGTAPRIVVNLNNSEAGDYIFYFKGSSKNAVATYTATIAGEDGTSYDKVLTGAQAKTADWGIDTYGTDHKLWLPSLPAGNFTLTFTVACSDGWKGHYGNFTFTKVDATLDLSLSQNLAADLDLGEPYTDGSNRFSTQETTNWVSLVRSTDTDHNRLLLGYDGYTLESTKHNDTVTFYIYINATAAYCLSYEAGTPSGNSGVSIAWSLFNASTDAEVYTVSNDVTPNSDSKWTLSNEYSNFLGTLESGYYVLTATVKRSGATSAWACNFGYFNFSECITLPSSNPLDLSAAKDNGSLKLTGNSQLSEGGNIENTKKDDTIKFFLYVPEYAKYAFAYKSGARNVTSTVTWTLADANGTAQNLDGSSYATDNIESHSAWTLVDNHSHKTDILPPGFYTLTGVISDASGWAGNFGEFSILRDAAYAKTTIGETTVYVEKDWLTAAYGSGTTTVPEGFSTVQSGKAIPGAEAYALGYNSIPAAGAVVVSPSITGTTMTFGFKDADADAAAARGATITYTLKTGTAADSLSEETSSSTALPTLDLVTVDSVKYIKLKADVSW